MIDSESRIFGVQFDDWQTDVNKYLDMLSKQRDENIAASGSNHLDIHDDDYWCLLKEFISVRNFSGYDDYVIAIGIAGNDIYENNQKLITISLQKEQILELILLLQNAVEAKSLSKKDNKLPEASK